MADHQVSPGPQNVCRVIPPRRAPPPPPRAPAAQPPHVAPRLASRLTAGVVPRRRAPRPRGVRKARNATYRVGSAKRLKWLHNRRHETPVRSCVKTARSGSASRTRGQAGADGTGPRPPRRGQPRRRKLEPAFSFLNSVVSPLSRPGRRGIGFSRELNLIYRKVIRFVRALGPTKLRYNNSTQPGATRLCRLDDRAPAFVASCSSDPRVSARTPATPHVAAPDTLEFTTLVHGAPPQYAPNVVHPSRQPPASPRTSCARWLHVHFAAAAVGMAPPHAWHGCFGLPDGRVRPVGAYDHAHIP